MVKDLFYASRKSIYELYTEGRLGNSIDYEGLKKMINLCTNTKVNEGDVQEVFLFVSKGKD